MDRATREKLTQAVRFYRGLGFFGQPANLSDEELAQQLNEQQCKRSLGDDPDMTEPLADLSLL
jgi:hypothetical protein